MSRPATVHVSPAYLVGGRISEAAYVVAYVIGSGFLMAATDSRLLVPVGVWIACYAGLMWYIVPR
jgi:hypothetical protein